MKHLTIRLISVVGLLSVCCLTTGLNAYVTIGSDKSTVKGAILGIKTQDADNKNFTSTLGGFGLPRVQLINKTTPEPFIKTTNTDWAIGCVQDTTKESQVGLMIYNLTSNLISTSITNLELHSLQGIYVWDKNQRNFVYDSQGKRCCFSPSANIPLTDLLSIKLSACSTFDPNINVYKSKFTKSGNDIFVSCNSTSYFMPSRLTNGLYDARDLDYIITHYDHPIFKVDSIIAPQIMNYDVNDLDTLQLSSSM